MTLWTIRRFTTTDIQADVPLPYCVDAIVEDLDSPGATKTFHRCYDSRVDRDDVGTVLTDMDGELTPNDWTP
jgi:hypothetical protein